MNRAKSNIENVADQSHGLLLLLLRLVTIGCALLVLIPYMQIGLFSPLQVIAGQQIVRLLLFMVIVLQAGHWLLAEHRGAFVVSVVVFAVLLFEVLHTIPLREEKQDSPEALRVMTFNSQGTPVGSWISWMDQDDADLVCIQEVRLSELDRIREWSPKHGYNHILPAFTSDSTDGIVLVSRIPFDRTSSLDIPEHAGRRRILPAVRIAVNGKPVHVVGVHLASTPRTHDLDGVGDAWDLREEQVEILLAWAEEHNDPVIAIGDFNATPTDGLIRRIRGPLDDMWMHGGSGVGGTWPAGLAFLRIDMVFTQGFDGMSDWGLNAISASDHISLSMTLHWDE